MQTLEYIRTAVEVVNTMVGTAMQDLTDEVVSFQPGGTANTIAQLLAHVVTGQDLLINDRLVLSGGTTLHDSGWAAKTGIPLDRRVIWQSAEWRLNLAGFDAYRLAVADAANRLIGSLAEGDLDRPAIWGRGPERPAGLLLQAVYINHGLGHCGEISAIKGMQGLKGLPL